MKVGQIVSAVTIVFLSIAGGIYTSVSGNEPNLGIDLQGGVSVVLVPTNSDDVSTEELDQAVEIIRSRVDGLGVAEPEIARQGDTISVILPGADQQQQAVDVIGQTAELRFRPVLADTGVPAFTPGGPLPTTPPADRPTAAVAPPPADEELSDGEEEPEDDGAPETTVPEDEEEEATPPVADGEAAANTDTGIRPAVFRQAADPLEEEASEEEPAETTVAEEEASEEEPDEEAGVELTPEDIAALQAQSSAAACGSPSLTLADGDNPEDVVFLPDSNGLLVCLGPVYQSSDDGPLLTGNALETAQVGQSVNGAWTVNPTFKPGASGIDLFNGAAAACNGQSPICPTGRLAAVLDQEVISAPSINASSFSRERVEISGTFTQEEAESLALQLRFGALPVELETGPVRQISASTGDDVLEAGVLAGMIGLGIVAIYLVFYYRLAGLVAIGGLLLSGLLLWTIIAFIGEKVGLALTLSGVVGLIVAIGVSADSNIVYFENVKDSYSQGRRVPTAIERAYRNAISTIVKADTVSLIAAVLLYFLTIGQVKGFALFLGLGTLLDLVISWMFMRPALAALSRLGAAQKNPRLLGLPARGKVDEIRS